MITTALTAFVLIFVMAGVVGLVDNWQASNWRQVAAERRRRWEVRRIGLAPRARWHRPPSM